jgi:CelD/BcsL family acetyltransferase involved in cellulose biosynthesis
MGSMLVLHALERAADEGTRAFDFLRGSEPYKYRFGARDRGDRSWLVPSGPAGALLHAIACGSAGTASNHQPTAEAASGAAYE